MSIIHSYSNLIINLDFLSSCHNKDAMLAPITPIKKLMMLKFRVFVINAVVSSALLKYRIIQGIAALLNDAPKIKSSWIDLNSNLKRVNIISKIKLSIRKTANV